MRYLIFGTGAIGGYFGGRLLQHSLQQNHQVDFIARGQQLAAIKANGLYIKSIIGDVKLTPINIGEQINPTAAYDVIFIAVKSYQLEQAMLDIKRVCTRNTVVIPLLNGIDIDQKLVQYGLQPHQIIHGFANIICKVSDYGVIAHSGGEPHITLGTKAGFHNKEDLLYLNPIIKDVANHLEISNVNVSIKEDITNAIWAKYLFVAPWAAISSLVKQPLHQIRVNKNCFSVLQQLIDEYALIAQTQGATLSENLIGNIKKGLERLPPESKTSMQNDVELHKDIKLCEFDPLLASAFYLAQKHHLNTPLLNCCFSCLSVKLTSEK